MKKFLKRSLVTFLSVLMLMDAVPLGIFAEEAQTEDEFRSELEASVDAEEYPDGVFDFLSGRMQTSENMDFVEFEIVRRGNTANAASVNFKAIDMSAEYGTDYYITVLDGLFGTKIEKNEDAILYIDEVDVEEEDILDLGEDTDVPEDADAPEEPEEDAEIGETALEEEAYDGTVQSAVRKATGRNYQSVDWRKEDKATLEALDAATNEMYDDIAGHEIRLDFAPGEYKKVLRFYTIDDRVSEDEEQVLFVLSHAEGSDLVPNPTGFMNIVDNDEHEEITYRFSQPIVTVSRDSDVATVKIERLTGIYRYDSLVLVSGEGSAAVGEYYDEVYAEVMFVPGKTEKTVKIPIKKHPLTDAVSFKLYTKDLSASTVIDIEPQIEDGVIYTETRPDEDEASLMGDAVPTRTATIDLMSSSYVRNTQGNSVAISDSQIELNNATMSISGIDLVMVDKISISHGENGAGSSYTYKSGCKKKTGWHTKKYNQITVTGQSASIKKYGKFDKGTDTLSLDLDARKKSSEIKLKSLGEDGCTSTHGYFDRKITVSYEPFFVEAGTSDPEDSIIRPNVYKTTGSYEQRTVTIDGKKRPYEFIAGTMRLKNGKTKDYFFNNDTVEVEPVWDKNLTEEERNGIYLWGIKFEKAAEGKDTEYYYYKGTSFNLRTLYEKGYKDYYTNDTIGGLSILKDGSVRGYKILPVFRQRTAFTMIQTLDDKMFEPLTFKNSDVIVTGRLDEININTVLYKNQIVSGWNAFYSEVSPSVTDERTYYASEFLREKNEKNYNEVKASGATELEKAWITGWYKGLGTFKQLNYGEAYPGSLLFRPNGMFNYVVASYKEPKITVAVNPRPANYSDQKAGQVIYVDEDSQAQYADYTGKDGVYARGHQIKIAPYGLQPYELSAWTDQPPEGYTYKVNWVDYTGDKNMDGELSEDELKALGSTVNALYGDYRRVYAGNSFTYVPKIVGDSLVYYQLRKVSAGDDDPDAPKRSLKGTVVLKSRTVIENTKGDTFTMKPIEGAVVHAGELSAVTDANGRWEILSENFESDEIHSVTVSYCGRIYNFNVAVGQYALEMPIQEYDTFDVTDFKVMREGEEIDPNTLNAEDVRHRYSFRITSLTKGIAPAKVEVMRYNKDGQLQKNYEAYADEATDEWVIRTEEALADLAKTGDDRKDYSFNPMGEVPPVAASDYLMIQITDNYGVAYIPHDAGIRYKAHLGMISVINTLVPKTGVVLDFIEKVGCVFDLGFSTTLDSGVRKGLEAAGVKFDEKTEDGVHTQTISWGFNKDFEAKYEPKEEKKKKTSGDTGEEKAKDAAEDAAEDLETVNEKPKDEQTEEEKEEAEKNKDEEKKDEASDTAKEAVDKKKNKKKTEFAANIKIDFSIAVSLELGYDEERDEWYFIEFLVVGVVAADASASYSYMTPIGVKIGIKATLSGDITALFGYSEYVKDKMHPEHQYLSKTGGIDVGSMGNRDINRKLNVYGKLMIRPTISLGVYAALVSENLAAVTLAGSAAFDMNFTSANTGAGYVKLTASLEVSLLFGVIKKTWTIAQKKYTMFEYAKEPTLFDLMGDGTDLRYDTITSEDISTEPLNCVPWSGNMDENVNATLADSGEAILIEEHVLSEEFAPEAMPKIERIHNVLDQKPGSKNAILIFFDAKEDGSPIRVLKYSFLIGNEWTEPVAFDPDSMGDDSHTIEYIGDDKIIISWSTNIDTKLSDIPRDRLNHRKLRTVIFDVNTETFGPIRELTKQTDGDNYADSAANFAYHKDADGKEYMVATYRKMVFEDLDLDDGEAALMVGDVINATTYIAYRHYDFVADDWIDEYDDEYLKSILGTEKEREQYEKDMYGQYFIDLSEYATTEASLGMSMEEIDEEQYPNIRNMYIWNQIPEAGQVCMADIGLKYDVVAQEASGYDGKAVFTYLVDIDGVESTNNDREIFALIYDFIEDKAYPPIRLTYNDVSENHIVITEMMDGLRLYYSADGNILSLKLSDILDMAVYVDTEYRGLPCQALLENRLPEYCVEPVIVLQKDEATNKSYDEFSMDWDAYSEYLFYTEPGISYPDGITAQDPEAALPENQTCERQLYALYHSVIRDQAEVTDENGETLLYPEKDDLGNTIDYSKVEDLLGEVGKVKAGDPVETWTYEDFWGPSIQLTTEKGANIFFADSIFDGESINSVYVKAYSELTEVEGVKMPVASDKNRQLILAKFNPFGEMSFEEKLDVTIDNIEDAFFAGESFDLQMTVSNPSFMEDDEIFVRIYQYDKTGGYELTDETVIGRVSTYESRTISVPMTLPEDLRDLDFYVEFSNEYLGEETVLARAEYRYKQPTEAITIKNVEKTLLDRNNVIYTVTVENTSNVTLDEEYLAVKIDNNGEDDDDDDSDYYFSDEFTLDPAEIKLVNIEAGIDEEDFVEERTDTMIYERARVKVYSENQVVEDVIERAGRREYEELLSNVKIVNALTGAKIANKVSMEKDGYLLLGAIPTGYTGSSLMLVTESADTKIASTDNLNGITANKAGKTKVTLHVAPNVSGYMAQLQGSDEVELYSDYNTLPSALVKDVTLTVDVANKKNDDEPAKKKSSDSSKTTITKMLTPKTFSFADVPKGMWYYDAVKYAFDHDLMMGVADYLFDPDGDVTRAMFVTVLYRMEGEPQTAVTGKFIDVPTDAYYAKAVAWASRYGIVKGISDSEYAPNVNITREQMAAILYRYAQYKDLDVSNVSLGGKSFDDMASVSDWAKDAMVYCLAKGLIQGDEKGNIAPLDNATRAQFATILMRAENILK